MNLMKWMRAVGSGKAKGHFGQYAEDVIVRKQFPKRKQDGRYLDIGAYHPFRFSNTAYLWMKGWSGVNVDANPKSIELFNSIRKGDTNICAAIVPQADIDQGLTEIELRLPRERDERSGISATGTLDERIAEQGEMTDTLKVPAKSVQQILNASDLRNLDYLNIDVEGLDEQIIADFDFDSCQPKVITIEDYAPNLAAAATTPTAKRLEAHGYELFARMGPTSVFRLG